MERFLSMAKRGVRIKVLTNSLEAADGPYVYSGFAKRRKALLESGITLYEMRRLSPEKDDKKRSGPLGSSGSSLHAKTFSVDRSRFFVGSFNFDPRSRKLNTELGFVIDSPVLAEKIEAAFHDSVPANSYEVRLSDSGQLYWIERRGDELVRHDKEPGTSWWLRAAVWVLSILPIEWLL
jgi:putative cardiolipin synthase